jgi:pimeloyl-ACP methyl ester carboxylesterase
MTQPNDRWVDLGGLRQHVREWLPVQPVKSRPAFLLLHGLSSNAATWDLVAAQLANEGFWVFSVDQRGHGLSDKPDDGYDFETLASDVVELINLLQLKHVILAGQSWGGNVVLEVAARFPGLAEGVIFVDGGFLNLRQRGTWEEVSRELRPPDLSGTPLAVIEEQIGSMHPGWIPEGVALTLKNLEVLPDGTVRPWLTLKRHMIILQALFDQDVVNLFPRVSEPVLICAAADGSPWEERKQKQVAIAAESIIRAEVQWFDGAAHDIHVDRPKELAARIIRFVEGLSQPSTEFSSPPSK